MKTHLLFLCSRNQWRSPTAEALFKHHPRYDARSAGTEPVTVTELSLDGDDVANFDIGRVALPARLQPEETLDIPLTFSPNAVGGFSAILVIETNIDESPTSERRLSGQSCNDADRDGRCDPNGPEAVDSGAPGG